MSSNKRRPTVHGLEDIMEQAAGKAVTINPDGSLSIEQDTQDDCEQESDVLTNLRRQLADLRRENERLRERGRKWCEAYGESGIDIDKLKADAKDYDDAATLLLESERRYERLREAAGPDESELIEALASLEHERWSGWEKYREVEALDPANQLRWKAQRDTPYSNLPEHSKESDRVEARKTLALLRIFGALRTALAQPEEKPNDPA